MRKGGFCHSNHGRYNKTEWHADQSQKICSCSGGPYFAIYVESACADQSAKANLRIDCAISVQSVNRL